MRTLVSDIANVIDWMDGAKVRGYHKVLQNRDIKIIYNYDYEDYLLIVDNDKFVFVNRGMSDDYERELIEEVTNACRAYNS